MVSVIGFDYYTLVFIYIIKTSMLLLFSVGNNHLIYFYILCIKKLIVKQERSDSLLIIHAIDIQYMITCVMLTDRGTNVSLLSSFGGSNCIKVCVVCLVKSRVPTNFEKTWNVRKIGFKVGKRPWHFCKFDQNLKFCPKRPWILQVWLISVHNSNIFCFIILELC